MTIVYVIGRGSQWGNNELRYSLRSIAKYGQNIDRVIVAGYPPLWLSDRVERLNVDDISRVKHVNILNCIYQAVIRCDLHGDFLYSSDDHFYVQPTNFNAYPIYCQGELPRYVRGTDPNYKYHTSLVSTYRLLKRYGLPTHRFSWHGNTWFNADMMREDAFRMMMYDGSKMAEGVEPTCVMLNYMLAMMPFEYIEREDIKLDRGCTEAEIAEVVCSRECVSSVQQIWDSKLADFLRAEFPKRCRYER